MRVSIRTIEGLNRVRSPIVRAPDFPGAGDVRGDPSDPGCASAGLAISKPLITTLISKAAINEPLVAPVGIACMNIDRLLKSATTLIRSIVRCDGTNCKDTLSTPPIQYR
jgi:hypothetical protein